MSNDFWQDHNFRLEPWGSDYEPPIDLSEELSASKSEVDPTVETDDWRKLKPQKQPQLPDRLVFIDGCCRIDAALVGGSGNTVAYGAFGTVAAGAVVVDRTTSTATCSQLTIRRIIGFGGNQEAPLTRVGCPLGSKAELVYEPVESSSANNPQIRKAIVQNAMLTAEALLAVNVLSTDLNTLVIRDGRLSYSSPTFTLGYVKTMHKNYLGEECAALLWELAPGERSPIFAIKDQKRPRWSWYVKSGSQICANQLGYHALHGIVRLELFSDLPLETAQKIADQTTYLIPEYASHPCKDPRAPQNLTPVGALERELGRRMGDAALVKRRVQHFLASVGVV